jgi:opacity protein-like surface antigen
MRKMLLASTFLLMPALALAADLPVKAPVAAAPITYCTLTSCTGFYAGGDLLESGGSFNVIGTGISGLASNDLALGGHAGYELWNGKWYLAAEGGADYGIVQKGLIPGGGNSALWDVYGLVKIGYSLASVFGATPAAGSTPTLPQSLTSALLAPYIILGVWDRPWGAGFASGAGVQALLATNWTLSVDYINVNYNNASVNPIVNQQSENIIRGAVDYHF